MEFSSFRHINRFLQNDDDLWHYKLKTAFNLMYPQKHAFQNRKQLGTYRIQQIFTNPDILVAKTMNNKKFETSEKSTNS